jgi:hypothetical protein
MIKKRNLYRPCSDSDIRSAALRATHVRLRKMDAEGKPTFGLFGKVESEEKAKLREFAEYMVKKGKNPQMTWDELQREVNKFAKDMDKRTDTK